MKKYSMAAVFCYIVMSIPLPAIAAAEISFESAFNTEQQKTGGSIIGTVIDIVSRNPIENATIEILGSTMKTQTSKTGQFTISNIPDGFYQLRATARDYTPSVQNNLYVDEKNERPAFFMLKKVGTEESQKSDNSGPVPTSTRSPKYPEEARKNGVEGIFYFKVKISETGSITAAKCYERDLFAEEGKLKSHQVFEKYGQAVNQMEKEALDAVWQWKFSPALKEGRAIEAEVVLPIKYKLSSE